VAASAAAVLPMNVRRVGIPAPEAVSCERTTLPPRRATGKGEMGVIDPR
jgi:hypothetical protein